jgi:hypothetical protein
MFHQLGKRGGRHADTQAFVAQPATLYGDL